MLFLFKIYAVIITVHVITVCLWNVTVFIVCILHHRRCYIYPREEKKMHCLFPDTVMTPQGSSEKLEMFFNR